MADSQTLASARRQAMHELMFSTETPVSDNLASSYFADFELGKYPFPHPFSLYGSIDKIDSHSSIKDAEPYPGVSKHISVTEVFFEEEEETLSSGSSVGDDASDDASDDDLSEGFCHGLAGDNTDYDGVFRIESAWETSMTAHPIPACRLAFAVSIEMAGLPKLVNIGASQTRAPSLRQRDLVTHRHIKHRSLSKAANANLSLRDVRGPVAISDTPRLTDQSFSASFEHKGCKSPVIRTSRTSFREDHDYLTSHSSASSDVDSLQISSSSRRSCASTTPSSVIHDDCNHADAILWNNFERFKQSLRSAEGRRTWGEILDGASHTNDDCLEVPLCDYLLTSETESCHDRSQIQHFNDQTSGRAHTEVNVMAGVLNFHAPPERQMPSFLSPMQRQDLSWIHEDAPQKLTYAAYDPYGSAPPTLSNPVAKKPRSYQRHDSLSSLFTGFSDWNLRPPSSTCHDEARSFMYNNMDTALGDLVARGESVKRSRWSIKRNHRRSLIST